MSITPLDYPYKLFNYPSILSKLNIVCESVTLNKMAKFRVDYLNQEGGILNTYYMVMSPDEYALWNDDSYVFEWVKNQLHLDKEEYEKYLFEGGAFCILTIEVNYLKSASVYVGIFDEQNIYTGSQKLDMGKEDYDIWTQSNGYLVSWTYNQLGKVPL